MITNKVGIGLVFLFFFAGGFAYPGENMSKIALTEFIKIACKNDTVFREILIDELSLKYRKSLVIPSGDVVLSIEEKHNVFLEFDEAESDGTVALSKLFPFTGTDISAEYKSSVSSSARTINSEFSALVSQPIAENAFGFSTRLLDKITGIEIDVAKYQIIEAYEDYFSTLTQLYLDWYSTYEDLETASNSYNENVKLLENIKERQANKVALPLDVNKIAIQVIAKKENMISLAVEYDKYLNLIKKAMRFEDEQELVPESSFLYNLVDADFDNSYQDFQTQSRTYQVLSLLEEKSAVNLDRDANALLPSIDLLFGYKKDGGGYDLKDSADIVYGGLLLEWPFLGQIERAQYEISKIALDKRRLSNEGVYAQLYTTLRNLYDAIELEKKLIVIADEKIVLAESIVEEERKNYSYGKVTLKDLIDEINSLEDSKFSKIAHTVQLRKLVIEWMRLTDTLVTEEEAAVLASD
jgi:outer membrane protein TolC